MSALTAFFRIVASIVLYSALYAPGNASGERCSNGAMADTPSRCTLIHHYNSEDTAADSRIMTNLHVQKTDAVRSMALIIGISEYPNMGGKLEAAENDLKHLEKFFIENQKFDEVVVLRDDEANRDNIDYFLRIYFVRRGEQFHGRSRLVVAYSGHGTELKDSTSTAIVLSQARNTFDPENLLPLRDLKAAFQRLAETNFHVLVLLNTCYGGGVFSNAAAGGNEAISNEPGAHGLTAGPSDDVVWSLGGAGAGSVFFDTLIEGISTGDADKNNNTIIQADGTLRQRGGVVRLASLLIYLTDRVDDINQKPPPSLPTGKKIPPPWIGSVEPDGKVARGAFFFLSPVTLAPGVQNAILNVPAGAVSSVPGRPELKVFNPPDVYGVRGIDVSSGNKLIDWSAVRGSSIQFAYIRATGQRITDTSFRSNWEGAGKVGIRRGAYHVFGFCEDPASQFRRIVAAIPKDDGALPLAVDLEFFGRPDAPKTDEEVCARRPVEQIRGSLLSLLEKVRMYYGKLPILYGGATAFQQLLDGRFKQYSVWLASYKKEGPTKTVNLGLSGGTAWTIWQHTEHGRVAGINDFVDQNVFFGTEEQFQVFAKGSQNLALEIAIGPDNLQ